MRSEPAAMRFEDRAYIPPAALRIMTARTLANSHPVLLRHLAPSRSVLDVGCGPGTLTAEMAAHVRPGHVVGMDLNPEMIRAAEQAAPPDRVPNLVFYTADIHESRWDAEFDVVNAARILQWVREPARAIERMAQAAAHGGRVVLLDYDHTRGRWSDPPGAWVAFYEAFLAWREAGGLDNAIAARLPSMCEAAGLCDVEVTSLSRTVRAADADFYRVAGLWRLLIESRGRQMVAAGHVSERARGDALEAFTAWMQRPDATQTTHEACVVARRP